MVVLLFGEGCCYGSSISQAQRQPSHLDEMGSVEWSRVASWWIHVALFTVLWHVHFTRMHAGLACPHDGAIRIDAYVNGARETISILFAYNCVVRRWLMQSFKGHADGCPPVRPSISKAPFPVAV